MVLLGYQFILLTYYNLFLIFFLSIFAQKREAACNLNFSFFKLDKQPEFDYYDNGRIIRPASLSKRLPDTKMEDLELNIKLVALDMDGTLLNSAKKLPPDFMEWVKSHPGIKTVIASGRPYYTIANDFIPVKDSLVYVAENGGLVFEKDDIICKNEMQKHDIRKCLEIISRIDGLVPVVCGAKSAYTIAEEITCPDIQMYYIRLQPAENLYQASLEDTVVKIAIFVKEKRAEQAIRYFTDLDDPMAAVLSGDSWIDISYRTSSKGAAVAAVQKKYGISREESMAFGDYLNDASLFEVCGESYCMANGHPDLRKFAKHIADTNDNDGVMKVLRQL